MSKTITRTMPDGSALYIEAGYPRGYFSVTASWPIQRSCGCLHSEVLQAFPALAPVIALHLSDAQTGAPMHAEANGWYWLAGALGGLGQAFHGSSDGYHTPAQALQVFAKHARVPLSTAQALAQDVAGIHTAKGAKEAREVFRGWVAAQAERWAAEAAAGRATLKALGFTS